MFLVKTLGNMSNPCTNRWGLNSYWYHYWYSDSFYAENSLQDSLFLHLLQVYLKYGLNTPSTVFWSWYWYKDESSSTLQRPSVSQYYRWITLNNHTLRSVNTYRLRRENSEVFQSKVTVLKFNAWVVINCYWFQPDKKRRQSLLRVKPVNYINHNYLSSKSNLNLKKLRTVISRSSILPAKQLAVYNF